MIVDLIVLGRSKLQPQNPNGRENYATWVSKARSTAPTAVCCLSGLAEEQYMGSLKTTPAREQLELNYMRSHYRLNYVDWVVTNLSYDCQFIVRLLE